MIQFLLSPHPANQLLQWQKALFRQLRRHAMPYQLIVEEGYLRGGMKKRVLRQLYYRQPPPPLF